MSPPKSNLDLLLTSLGSPGKCQILTFILLCTNAFPITFNFVGITFSNNVPTYHCKLPNETRNLSEYLPIKSNSVGKTQRLESCKRYVSPENKTTVKCNEFTFNTLKNEATIATEWHLICENEFLAPLASTIFFAGVMIGGLVFGTIADKIGRKPVVLICLYGQAVLGLSASFANSYILYVILKFFQGMLIQGLQSSNNSLVLELFSSDYRTTAGMVLAMCSTTAHMIMAFLLYFVRNWRHIQLLISGLTTVSLMYSWFYPESIRWLLSQNRQQEALHQANKMTKFNQVPLPVNTVEKINEVAKEIISKSNNNNAYDLRDLFRNPTMRRYSFMLFYLWFSVALCYYGIQFYMPKMSGDRKYLMLFISGAMETSSRFAGYFIIKRVGRRLPLIVCYTVCGILCIASGMIGDFLADYAFSDTLANILAVLGKLFSSQVFAFIIIYSSEIFPTVLRTIGGGAVACFTRIGVMIAPQILLLMQVSHFLPFLILGAFAIVAAFLLLLMPETLGRPLPNTVDEIENFKYSSEEKKEREEEKNTLETDLGIINPALTTETISKNE